MFNKLTLALAEHFGRISTVTIIPGYDDTKNRKPGLKIERMEGELYRQMWEMAIKLDPDWILITSFNEWHEGSEIDTSLEYRDIYVKITAEYTFRFKSSPRRPRRLNKGISAFEKSEIPFGKARRQVQRAQDGVLTGYTPPDPIGFG